MSALYSGLHLAEGLVGALGAARDGVVQIEAARPQQPVHGAEIGRVIGDADLLEHADRGDLVELALHLGEVLAASISTRSCRPSRAIFSRASAACSSASVTPVRLDAVMLRGMADQRAPAAADVEQAIAGLQPQLAADHVELVALRAGEIVVPVRLKVGAGIDHLRIEEEPVEGVRDVVVIGDVRLVGGGRAVAARPVAPRRPVERARHVGGRAQEMTGGLERLELAQDLRAASDLALRPLVGEIEDRAVLEIDEPRHMRR